MNRELIEISKEESLILIDLKFPKIISNTDVGSDNIKSYELKNFDKNNTLKATLNLYFNIEGNLEKNVMLIPNSKEEIKKYQYNDKQALLKIGKAIHGGNITTNLEYVYDEKNRLVKIVKGKNTAEVEFEYEEEKIRIKKEYKFHIGAGVQKKLAEIQEFEWDNDKVVKIKKLYPDGEEILTTEYIYNNQENSVLLLLQFPDDEAKKTKYFFNSEFKIVEKRYFYEGDLAATVKIDYDKGLKIQEEMISDDEKSMQNWKYDDFNNKIKYVRKTNTGISYEENYSYKYDRYNNWISRTINKNGNILISKREIKYY